MQADIVGVAPYFAISAVLLVVAALVVRHSAFYAQLIDEEQRASRFHAIDGLRGFLALGVFFHHAVIGWFFHLHGRWEEAPSNFYTFLGQGGVGLFFMITAFLFWRKGLAAGRRLDMLGLIESRILRLAPMYLASVACVWAVAAVLTGFHVQSPWALPRQMLEWLSFGMVHPGEFNGFAQAWHINANVQWSLAYEWLFYLFLPLGLMFARGWRFVFAAALAAAFIWKFSWRQVEWNFLFGALAAVLGEQRRGVSGFLCVRRWIELAVG
jgi:peptidoglycan/LPS O-acetylase OafA/YrhL